MSNHRRALLGSVAAAVLVLGCGMTVVLHGCNDPVTKTGGELVPSPEHSTPPGTPTPAGSVDLAAAAAAPTPVDPGQVSGEPTAPKTPSLYVRSSRCGECHERMRSDWLGSAHAKASHSPAYRRSLAAAPPALHALCSSCHLPSLAAGQPDDEPGRPSEGVSCDGCHTLSAVQVQKTSATMTFDPRSGKKYGPILGASGHYFHDMAYSPLHTKSEFCAGCHHLTEFKATDSSPPVPVVTDFADWQRLGIKKSCQDCHMPSRGSEIVARGSNPRPNVPSHAFPGAQALSKTLKFALVPRNKPGEIAVEIQHTAGHMLPSGYVDRRLIVRAEWTGSDGSKIGSEDRAYGIILSDDAGLPVPFWKATKIKQDHRMAPGKSYVESFRIPPAPPAIQVKLTLSLLAAPTAPDLSATYGEPELTLLKSTSANVPSRPGGK